MIEVNLLPWRDSVRLKRKKIQILLIVSGCIGVVLLLSARHFVASQKISAARQHAARLKAEFIKSERINQQIRQLKYVGYLHQDNKTWGVLMLPTGEIQEVQVGTSIRQGHARVVGINEKCITVILSNHQKRVIKMMSVNNVESIG